MCVLFDVVAVAGTLKKSNLYRISSRAHTLTHIQKNFQYNRKFKNRRRRFESVWIDVSCWTDENVCTIDDWHEQQWLKIKYEHVMDLQETIRKKWSFNRVRLKMSFQPTVCIYLWLLLLLVFNSGIFRIFHVWAWRFVNVCVCLIFHCCYFALSKFLQ